MATPQFPMMPDGMPMPEAMDAMIGSESQDAPIPDSPFAPAPKVAPTLETGLEEADLVQLCREWKEEARSGRQGGTEPRDDVWSANLDLYHGRMDFSDKEDWQHQEVFRDATKHVDRFAAACKRAVMQPGDWYAVKDWTPGADLLHGFVKRLTDVMLSRCSTTTSGYPTGFRHVFSKILKMGGVMSMAASVTKDPNSNRIRIDEVDPRELFFDPTGRGMYRLRTREVDAHTLSALAAGMDGLGQPLYHQDRVADLEDMRRDEAERESQQATGHTQGARPMARKTHVVDEFLFRELLNRDGVCVAKNVLVVMGNERRIIRGPEPNPYWHGRDWIVFQPLLDTFLSVYGRAYMEDFSAACRTYIRFTALLLDGATVSMLPNYAIKPDMLQDPTQVDDGLRPFKMWFVNDDAMKADEFAHRMELGRLGPQDFEVWRGLKGELREGAMQNQMELGQVPQKSGITATEVASVRESGSEMVMDVAENIDDGLLSPLVELTFWTAVQELDFADPALAKELGEDIASMFAARRSEFQGRKFSFKAAAISALSERAVRSNKITQVLQVLGQSEILQQEFLKTHSLDAVLGTLWRDMGIDAPEYARSRQEGDAAIPPEVQARIATEQAATARHQQGAGTDERRAMAAEQQTAIAAAQAAQEAESAQEDQGEPGEES